MSRRMGVFQGEEKTRMAFCATEIWWSGLFVLACWAAWKLSSGLGTRQHVTVIFKGSLGAVWNISQIDPSLSWQLKNWAWGVWPCPAKIPKLPLTATTFCWPDKINSSPSTTSSSLSVIQTTARQTLLIFPPLFCFRLLAGGSVTTFE